VTQQNADQTFLTGFGRWGKKESPGYKFYSYVWEMIIYRLAQCLALWFEYHQTNSTLHQLCSLEFRDIRSFESAFHKAFVILEVLWASVHRNCLRDSNCSKRTTGAITAAL
jgi:hypothetical protein